MAITKPTHKTMSIMDLKVDPKMNVRDERDYDIPTMIEQILEAGRILSPILALEDGTVLVGNRRTRAGQKMYDDPTTPVGVKESLEKVQVVIYGGDLTEQERLKIIIDHGSQKPLAKSDVARAIWRMAMSFMSETEIINVMYFMLAKFTGQERKLAEVPENRKARETHVKKWFHGTVGNYILAANSMGEYVKEQFLLTLRAEDKLLQEGESVEMRVTRGRLTELSAARTTDKNSDEGWSPENGGTAFNALIEQFKAEDRGEIKPENKKRPTITELEKQTAYFQTPALRKILLLAAGETDQSKIGGLPDDDARIWRDSKCIEVLATASFRDQLPESVKDFVKHLLHDKKWQDFEKYLESIAPKVEEPAPVVETPKVEEPKAETPPVVETPKVEKPKVEAKVEQPAPVEQKTEVRVEKKKQKN